MKSVIRKREQLPAYSLIRQYYYLAMDKMNQGNYYGAALDFRIVNITYKTARFDRAVDAEIIKMVKDSINCFEDCYHQIMDLPAYVLSKTSFVYGMQCKKRLYLSKYFPEKRTPPDAITREKFALGHSFEYDFKKTFKGAVDVKAHLGNRFRQYPDFTFRQLADINYRNSIFPSDSSSNIFFEAGFLFNGVMVLVDVLERDDNENYKVYEVKNYAEIKDVTWWDLSVQYYVLSNILTNIDTFNVVLRSENGGFNIVDVQEELKERMPFIQKKIESFKEVLQSEEIPDVAMGEHCEKPYKCDFIKFCSRQRSK